MATQKRTMKLVDQNDETTTTTDLESLKAQRAALNEQIKAAQASAPKATPLERVIQRQSVSYEAYMPKVLAKRTLARIAAGQDRHLALADVLGFFEAKANEAIDEAIDEALDRDRDADAKMDSGK